MCSAPLALAAMRSFLGPVGERTSRHQSHEADAAPLDQSPQAAPSSLCKIAGVADKGAGFRSLADAWADTTTSHGRLMLTVLGGLAEFERDLIRSRTTEGRARAVARGVKMGRPSKLTAHQKKEAIKRRDHGEETLAEIGRSYNVSGWTIARLT